jgi:hypothetical protein
MLDWNVLKEMKLFNNVILKNINLVEIATFYMKMSNYSLINIVIGPTFNDWFNKMELKTRFERHELRSYNLFHEFLFSNSKNLDLFNKIFCTWK